MKNPPKNRVTVTLKKQKKQIVQVERFKDYLSKNKKYTYIFILFYIAFAFVLKYCYPYVDLTPDSGGYINWIEPNFPYGGPRPMGYSYFLNFSRSLAVGSGLLFVMQYLVHCLSTMFFYHSTVYIFSINNTYLKYSYLFCVALFIPGLYVTNMVMSESLFISLTTIMITFFLWSVYRPTLYFLLPIVLLPVLIMTIRYVGLVFPIIIIPFLLIVYKNKVVPLAASLLLLLFMYGYVQKVKTGTLRDQGVEVFSAFAGWQKANNAVHVIPHIDINEPSIGLSFDNDMCTIDTIVRYSYKYNSGLYPSDDEVSFGFIWVDSLPLRQVFNHMRRTSRNSDYYYNWNKAGKLFNKYANLVIENYPVKYLRYYIANNILRTLHPPEEIFDAFSPSTQSKVVPAFFGWNKKVNISPKHDFLRPVLKNLSWMYSLYWFMLLACVSYIALGLIKKRISTKHTMFKGVMLMLVFIGVYTAANIYGAPVNLRFLLPIRMCVIAIVFILLQHFLVKRVSENRGVFK